MAWRVIFVGWVNWPFKEMFYVTTYISKEIVALSVKFTVRFSVLNSDPQLWAEAIIFAVSIQLFLMPSETLDSAQQGVSALRRPSFTRGVAS